MADPLKMSQGSRVLVTRQRGGLELRVNGTLASLHQPGSALTGPVWWALASGVILIPAPVRRRRRVLLLGLGGGSVARVVRTLDPEAEIIGVERDRDVLRLARRHFGLDKLDVEVVVEDAFRYLRSERRRFDLIVEDLFVGSLRSVRKPPGLLDEGYRLIGRRLRPGGLVASNTIHETPAIVNAMRPLGGRIAWLDVHGYWNRIVLCGRGLPSGREIRRRLKRHGAFDRLLSTIAVKRLAP